ncbi:GMP/IMP nucleotidase [Sulfuriflexus mobilis]|uniref:GMP/IMP nucleotidase n=1 Tax=Sulfuriflexus mobilis TaxID=1811807 RepID=UPI000F817498|nr:GMP/IMP nucleotidase [Sulfuriflexus mobilis]
MLDWNAINTVFLDMDGTLLDLNFDNHFWQEHVPLRYAEYHGLDIDRSKEELFPRFRAAEGTMEWYCVDYWSQELGLDIAELKREVEHLIAIHPYVIDFLDAVRAVDKRVVLVTNAHAKSLDLKMKRTRLGGHFDSIICAHDLGMPKEHREFWQSLQSRESFEPAHTLLIDDSLPVLRSAMAYGITHLLAIHKPDTQAPNKDVGEFNAIYSFNDIMPT